MATSHETSGQEIISESRLNRILRAVGHAGVYGALGLSVIHMVVNPINYYENHRSAEFPELDEAVTSTAQYMGLDPNIRIMCRNMSQMPINRLLGLLPGEMNVPEAKTLPYITGVAKVPGSTIHISERACLDIAGMNEDSTLSPNEVVGVIALAHESAHNQGVFNESDAVCISYQRAPEWLMEYGFSAQQISVWRDSILQLTSTDPVSYQLKETCVEGGPDDLTPESINEETWIPR